MKASIAQFHKDNPNYHGAIPADALTASGSGLDPDISLAYADIQADRVAEARHTSAGKIKSLIASNTSSRDLGILGEPRVNVLQLNLALDKSLPKQYHTP